MIELHENKNKEIIYDIITVGGITQDIFVETDEAKIFNIETVSTKQSHLCFDYGAKIELDKLANDIGGGASNTAANFANLSLKTAIIGKIGSSSLSSVILKQIEEKNVDVSMVSRSKTEETGISVILVSYEGDRTVLMKRGANSSISINDIDLEKIKQTKWLYIASLSGKSNSILDKLADFAEKNEINLAFNPGTSQIKRGVENLKKVLEKAEILIMNRSEASIITNIANNPPEYPNINDENLKEIILKLSKYEPKIIVITEGKKGVYSFNGKTLYYCPTFPSKVVSTLGAGDAFASTFVASIIKYKGDIEKSLKIASINSASVIQSFGAQLGFKTFEELEDINNKSENYKTVVQKTQL